MLHSSAGWAAAVSRLAAGGPQSLQLILDFDRTCTVAGSVTSHGLLESLLPPAARAETAAMLAHYHPIEMDARLTVAEKLPQMLEWYERAHALLAASGVRRSALRAAAAAAAAQPGLLRRELRAVLACAAAAAVPVLILTAGVADVVEEVLVAVLGGAALPSGVSVVGNHAVWRPCGGGGEGAGADEELVGWRGQLVHMYNKGEAVLAGSPMFAELCRRTNILLCGDSLGDARMADGLGHATAVVRLGILNARSAHEEHMLAYAAAFDAVFVSEDSLAPLLDALQAVVGGGAAAAAAAAVAVDGAGRVDGAAAAGAASVAAEHRALKDASR